MPLEICDSHCLLCDTWTVVSSWAEFRIHFLIMRHMRVLTAQHRKRSSETFPGCIPRQSQPKKLKPHSSLVSLQLGNPYSPPQLFPHVTNLDLNSLCLNTQNHSQPLWYCQSLGVITPSQGGHLSATSLFENSC